MRVLLFSTTGTVLISSTKFDAGKADAADVIERESSRPDFQIVVYPAIPKNLTFAKNTPPAFLACGNQDRPNISEGLANVYLLFKRAGVSAELHIYAKTGHGFGIQPKNKPPASGQNVNIQNPPKIAEFLLTALLKPSHADGVTGDQTKATPELGKMFIGFKVKNAVEQIWQLLK